MARGFLFRLSPLMALLLLLACLETGLRMGGYGFSGEYLRTREIGGSLHWVEDRSYFRAYFPPNLVPHVEPLAVPVAKAPGTLRLVIMGESAALGTPDPAFGFGRLLDRMLRHRYPDLRFEIVNTSATAVNSHVLADMASRLAGLEPDLFILYAGNNEVIGPYGPGSVFAPFLADIRLVKLGIFLRRTRSGQLLLEGWRRLAWKFEPPRRWAGLEMFRDRAIAPDAPCLGPVYGHFRSNLRDIVAAARDLGAEIILCTVAANLRDFAPLASLPAIAAPELGKGGNGAASGDSMASGRYRKGQDLLRQGRYREAAGELRAARDLDALRFRADSRINAIIREIVAERVGMGTGTGKGVHLADAEKAFRDHSAHGLPGKELFHEHVHLTFAGNHLLARTVMSRIDSMLVGSGRIASAPVEEVLDMEACRRELGLTGWGRLGMAEKIAALLSRPPFIGRPGGPVELRRAQDEVGAWSGYGEGENPERPGAGDSGEALEEARQALEIFPEDPILHRNLGEYLYAMNALGEAGEALGSALEGWPHDARTRQLLARCLAGQGRLAEAARQYRLALEEDPGLPELRNGLGNLLARQGDHQGAIGQYRIALRAQPNLPEIHFNLGRAYGEQEKPRKAAEAYRQALALDPAFEPAARALDATP